MPWYALDSLDDAREATESLLRPFGAGTWLRLALIAFFVGGGTSLGSGSNASGQAPAAGDVPFGPGPDVPFPDGMPALPDLPANIVALAVGLVLLAVAIGVVYSVLGSILEFVLIDGLRTGTVSIRSRARQHLGKGLRLFGFRLALVLVFVLLVVVPFAWIALGAFSGRPGFLVFLLPLVLFAIVVGFAFALVERFTTDFVIPTMLAEDRGVLSAWRRVFPLLRRDWKQVGVYVVVRFVLQIAAAIAVGLIMLLATFVVALPFVIVGGVLYVATVAGSAVGPSLAVIALFAVLVAIFLLVLFVLGALVQVPVITYLRYYALFVLGSIDESLDLVEHHRTPAPDAGAGAADDER